MVEKELSFEENMEKLETIVSQLEQGDVPLEKALSEFKEGIDLSKQMQGTLQNAEKTLTKMMDENDKEIDFKRDQGSSEDDGEAK